LDLKHITKGRKAKEEHIRKRREEIGLTNCGNSRRGFGTVVKRTGQATDPAVIQRQQEEYREHETAFATQLISKGHWEALWGNVESSDPEDSDPEDYLDHSSYDSSYGQDPEEEEEEVFSSPVPDRHRPKDEPEDKEDPDDLGGASSSTRRIQIEDDGKSSFTELLRIARERRRVAGRA